MSQLTDVKIIDGYTVVIAHDGVRINRLYIGIESKLNAWPILSDDFRQKAHEIMFPNAERLASLSKLNEFIKKEGQRMHSELINRHKTIHMKSVVAGKDNIIKAQIYKKLGNDVDIESLEGRLELRIQANVETYCLDNEPLIEFYPPDFGEPNLRTIDTTLRYKILQ